MQVTIDEQEILTEILERDGSVHRLIKSEVKNRLIGKLVGEIEDKFFNDGWRITDEINRSVLAEVEKKQVEITKQILKEFYDKVRRKQKDVTILKELKHFVQLD